VKKAILGICHITAIAGDAPSNVDFCRGLLGLPLVKITVNFDDPAPVACTTVTVPGPRAATSSGVMT
jgi:catechol 2,3-dioxygenase-like lactoylglutathione lyase family enzyme